MRGPLPIASLLRDRFLTLLANGGEELDWSAIGAVATWEAGVVKVGELGRAQLPGAAFSGQAARNARRAVNSQPACAEGLLVLLYKFAIYGINFSMLRLVERSGEFI